MPPALPSRLPSAQPAATARTPHFDRPEAADLNPIHTSSELAALKDSDIDDEVLLDRSGSPDYRAVTYKRLTRVSDFEDSYAYHLRAAETFNLARDVTRRLLHLPGSGALLAIQPRDVIEVRGIVRGPAMMDLPAAWRLRTKDSDAAYAVELVTAKDVRRHVLDVLSIRMDVDPIDLVARWLSGPPMRTRRYGSFRHGCRRGSVFDMN